MGESMQRKGDIAAPRLLFLCTHNRCRSILCEALARHLSDGRIAAFSAGSQPARAVHPDTLWYRQLRGVARERLRSQSREDFAELSPAAMKPETLRDEPLRNALQGIADEER